MIDGQPDKSDRITMSRKRRIPMVAVLGAAFSLVAVISSVAYFFLLYGATITTEDMLHDRTRRLVEDEVQRVRALLNPVAEELELLAVLVSARHLQRTAIDEIAEVLSLAVNRMPGVVIAEFHGPDQRVHRVVRAPDGSTQYSEALQAEQPLLLLKARVRQAGPGILWGPLRWSFIAGQTVVELAAPIYGADGSFVGAFVVALAISQLSERTSDANPRSNGASFIIVDHDKVLAHHRLNDPRGLGLSEQKPLPRIDEVDDAVLAAIWNEPAQNMWFDGDVRALGHVADMGGKKWLFVHRVVSGYGPDPWFVGRYFPIEEVTGALSNLAWGALVGAGSLVFAFLLAVAISLKVGRLIGTITSAAKAIGRLQFGQVYYQPSRVREIDDAGSSLDRARDALNWFGAYVPKSLIRRIMEAGEAGLVSRKQLVTVMFTDIVQFSQLTRNMPGDEVADLLNHHFALLGACIERERGVVDKFIGDAVMAVWGGIGGLAGHADSAVRAALAIARALQEDNVARQSEGRPPIRVRIGIHSGPVVAGNIGSADRVNYTVVGDTVNVAQRLEQVGKEFVVADEVVTVLVSADTVAALKDPFLVARFCGEPIVCQGKTGDDIVKCFKLSLASASVVDDLDD